jgi:hypothetical protein
VLSATTGAAMSWREKAFLSWLAPRGIVAAAVASLFAESLAGAGIGGGRELRAMVFLVIALTVLVEGTLGGAVAGLLRVRRAGPSGYLVLGANALGRELARVLRGGGEDVVLLDTNRDACRIAVEEGLDAVHGSADDDELLDRLQLADRRGAVALTSNEDLNLHFARRARQEHRVPDTWVAQRTGHLAVSDEMIRTAGAHALFGRPGRLETWADRLERGAARVREMPGDGAAQPGAAEVGDAADAQLPLALEVAGRRQPWDERSAAARFDRAWVLTFEPGPVAADPRRGAPAAAT